MATREEEMAKLRDRYARLQKGDTPVEKPKPREESPIIKTKVKKPRLNLKPYLFLIENDIRKLFRLPQKEWKVGGLKFETIDKPLNLEWLEKKGGKLF
ncbi:MAG: hypothetical protein WCX79_00900 [Candidatus Paceibacterota bacterium]|jgi:hypothetical protein